MIAENKKELVDKRLLWQEIAKRADDPLSPMISIFELADIFEKAPIENDLKAEWIYDDDFSEWICSWCSMPKQGRQRYCAHCGRRMRRKTDA